jgi:hypothetical protein
MLTIMYFLRLPSPNIDLEKTKLRLIPFEKPAASNPASCRFQSGVLPEGSGFKRPA